MCRVFRPGRVVNHRGARVRICGLLVFACVALLITPACQKDSTGPDNNGATWDIDGQGIPKFVNVDYVDLSSIEKISRFRSASGHDYSHDDYLEGCRSMKHYFWPKGGDPGWSHTPSWTTIAVHSPAAGTVTRTMAEYAGTQIWIQPTEYPAFQFRIFHVALVSGLDVGDAVAEGQLLGHHGGDETMSDIAVCVATPGGSRLVSYFDVMSDALFQQYQARGVLSRSQLIITKQERDADPLTCDGETFTSSGHLENWVQLAPARIQAVPAQETGPARQPAMDASKPYRLHPQHLGRPPGVGRG